MLESFCAAKDDAAYRRNYEIIKTVIIEGVVFFSCMRLKHDENLIKAMSPRTLVCTIPLPVISFYWFSTTYRMYMRFFSSFLLLDSMNRIAEGEQGEEAIVMAMREEEGRGNGERETSFRCITGIAFLLRLFTIITIFLHYICSSVKLNTYSQNSTQSQVTFLDFMEELFQVISEEIEVIKAFKCVHFPNKNISRSMVWKNRDTCGTECKDSFGRLSSALLRPSSAL